MYLLDFRNNRVNPYSWEKSLPVPEQAHRLQVTDFLPPQTALEELIAETRGGPDWPS